jgi:hypothetical protein
MSVMKPLRWLRLVLAKTHNVKFYENTAGSKDITYNIPQRNDGRMKLGTP